MLKAIRTIQTTSIELSTDNLSIPDLKCFFEKEAKQHALKYLLAHADDGVNWGRFDSSGLELSADQTNTVLPFTHLSLQSARLFSETGEVYLQKQNSMWFYRRITENETNKDAQEYFDEERFLLGTTAKPLANDFSLLTEGATGQQHAVPLKLTATEVLKRPTLIVRSYLNKVKALSNTQQLDLQNRVAASVVLTRLAGFKELSRA